MKKILIVEDDQIVANIYRNKFSVEGYQVEIASDGQAGLETLHTFKPDAVILDLMLPKITGVELMKKVRAEPQFKNLPIIVFSNTYLTNMVQDAWKAGATKCLSKANCSPKQLLEVVHTTLAGNGATPAAAAAQGPPTTAAAQATAPAAAPAPASGGTDWDAQFQAELKQSFVETLPAAITTLRASLQAVIKNEDESTRVKQLQEMYRKVHGLTSNAGITGIGRIAQMCDALEALLKELHEKPRNINASTLRTVASAIDFLSNLLERKAFTDDKDAPTPKILVVDDEAISRRAVTYALKKPNSNPSTSRTPKMPTLW